MNSTSYINETAKALGLFSESQNRVADLLKSLNADKSSLKDILELFERIQDDEKDVQQRM